MYDYLTRIRPSINVERLQRAHATVIGSAPTLIANLARSGLAAATIVDPQTIEASNVARQDYPLAAVGLSKVEAVIRLIHSVNPDTRVVALQRDFCTMTDDEIDE